MPIAEAYRNAMADNGLPNTQYVALFVGDPLGAGSEITGTGYARIAMTMGASSGGVRTNTTAALFDTGSATDWPANVNYSALMSASSGGAVVSADPLDATRDMSGSNSTVNFAIGQVTQEAA